MKIEHLVFPTNKFPCFGFAVGSKNDDTALLPEYDNDIVCNFQNTVFEGMYFYEYNGEYNIEKGDKRTYVYMFSDNEFIVGKLADKRDEFIQALNGIQDAPFSKLELAEFLKVDTSKVIQECYAFLEKIDKEYARQWAVDNSILIETPLIEKYRKYLYPFGKLDETINKAEKCPGSLLMRRCA